MTYAVDPTEHPKTAGVLPRFQGTAPSHPQEIVASGDWSEGTQEILDTLPQGWSRSVLYLMITFSAVALPWAMMAQVDEVGMARGRLEPKGKTLQLDMPVGGQVAKVHLQEGSVAQAGQPLLELESATVEVELRQAQVEREGQLDRLAQLGLMRNQLELALRTQILQQQAQVAEQEAQIIQTQQQLRFAEEDRLLLEQLLIQDQDQAQRLRALSQEGVLSRVESQTSERRVLETEQRLQQAKSVVEQTQIELQKQRSSAERIAKEGEITQLQSQRQIEELRSQIVTLETQIRQGQTRIAQLNAQWQQRTLHMPVDGTVFQMPVKNAGSVVQAGQTVAQIAPVNAPLVLRAQVTNRDSGFLKPGLPVKLKLDAYPYQDYGIVEGEISWVSPDSRQVQPVAGNPISPRVFDIEVGLHQAFVKEGDRKIRLTPGQTANAEIIIRQRKMLDLLIDPFKKIRASGIKL